MDRYGVQGVGPWDRALKRAQLPRTAVQAWESSGHAHGPVAFWEAAPSYALEPWLLLLPNSHRGVMSNCAVGRGQAERLATVRGLTEFLAPGNPNPSRGILRPFPANPALSLAHVGWQGCGHRAGWARLVSSVGN